MVIEGLFGKHLSAGAGGAVFQFEAEYQPVAEALLGVDREGARQEGVEPGRQIGPVLGERHHLPEARSEPVGVVLPMQFTQEGQMPALIGELVLPVLNLHYGYGKEAPEVLFFAEHEIADEDHSRWQLELADKYLDTPELCRRAEEVAGEMCRLRWGCTSDTYRMEHLGQWDEMPPGFG